MSQFLNFETGIRAHLGDEPNPIKKMEHKPESRNFRIMAQIAVMAGAIVSLAMMFYTGRHQQSIILILLFTGWVLAPFVAMLMATRFSWPWSALTRTTLFYILMVVITLSSLVGYTGLLNPPGTPAAAVFLVVPFLSWVLLVIFIGIGALVSRRRKQ